MANNTIYPYGVGGYAPSGNGIVNDLSTGGADKALSAAMGKKLRQDELYADQGNAMRNAAYPTNVASWFGSDFGKAVNLLHFSDIHGDGVNLARIVAFKESVPGLEALFTGDMVNSDWNGGIAFWTGVTGAENIMTVIGNHDTLSGGNWYAKNAADCYGRYISPFVANWGVTYQANLCYYYKDWSAKNVRLIVLDYMHWDSTQASWLVSTLASAKSEGYHVVVAGHCTPAASDNGVKDCPFDTLGANRTLWESEAYGKMDSAAAAAVQDFIDGGGKFVCWLTGHTHADMFRHLSAYPTQLYVAVANAGTNENVSSNAACQLARSLGERSQDLFNLVSINATRQTLTIVRVGADRDTIGRHIGTVVYDYANKEILNCGKYDEAGAEDSEVPRGDAAGDVADHGPAVDILAVRRGPFRGQLLRPADRCDRRLRAEGGGAALRVRRAGGGTRGDTRGAGREADAREHHDRGARPGRPGSAPPRRAPATAQ